MSKSATNANIVEYIYNADKAFESKRVKNFKRESQEGLILPLRVITLLTTVSGLFAMIFEVRYFSQFATQIYFTRLTATIISFTILWLLHSKHALKFPIALVHILLMTIICSSGYMILLIPSSLIVNSQIVGLMIFTSALFLSWDLKHQIIVAIYYNLVFSIAILLNDKKIYFLPNMYESVLFVIFLSVISVIGSSVNYKLRTELADKSFRVKLSERKFRSIFEHAADGIFQSSPEGKFLTANKALVEMLGYNDEDDLKKTNIPEDVYLKHSDRDKLLTILQHKGEVSGYRLRLKRKDNSNIVVRINERVVREYPDTKIYFEGNLADITEQVKLEEDQIHIQEELKLERMKSDKLAKEAVKSNEVKSQFLANMSHEIRTPINGILGFLSFIENGQYKDEAELKEFISTAKSSAESLLDLVNDILDFSKIEAGKMELDEIGFNISKVTSDATSMIIPVVTEKGLKLNVNLDKHIPAVLLGDSMRLRQILINLLSNAVKFTEKGNISLNVVSEKIAIDKVKLQFSVKDTGVGIPQEKVSQLFKPFSQVDGSYTRKFNGTGLGLVICRELVSLMNGSIWVESELGKGSAFSFTCILKFERQASFLDKLKNRVTPELSELLVLNQDISQNSNVKFQRKALRILVAEDNPVNKKVVMKILDDAGYVADVVPNGSDAVLAIANSQQRYNLILMDVQMPVMDGFEATRQIKIMSPFTSRLPIIALTAHATSSDREKCLASGMNDYLSKPIKNTVLIAMVDKWLGIDYSVANSPSITGTSGVSRENILSGQSEPDVIEKSAKAKPVKKGKISPVNNTEPVPGSTEVDIESFFDITHFRNVSLDDEEFKKDLLITYIDDTKKRIALLGDHIEQKNLAAIASGSHTIKGASYSVGAKALGDKAKEIEFAGKANDMETAQSLFGQLLQEYNRLVSVQDKLLQV